MMYTNLCEYSYIHLPIDPPTNCLSIFLFLPSIHPPPCPYLCSHFITRSSLKFLYDKSVWLCHRDSPFLSLSFILEDSRAISLPGEVGNTCLGPPCVFKEPRLEKQVSKIIFILPHVSRRGRGFLHPCCVVVKRTSAARGMASEARR